MSLRMAVLALLTARPMTGFDFMRQFDSSVGYLWSAPHTQIYPELRKLESEGLVAGEELPRGQRGKKRLYRITEAGRAELHAMMDDVQEPRRVRDPLRLRAAYMEWASPEVARRQLQTHLEYYMAAEALYQQQHDLIVAQEVPLLVDRLSKAPAEQHEAIIAFKAFAYDGMVKQARAEIEWAKEGLELLDRLSGDHHAPNAAVANSGS